MASIGINVAADGSADPILLRSLGATWIRVVAVPRFDLTDYFRRCRAANLRILLVFARESGGNYARYAEQYASLIDSVQVGNEPDHVSPSSWTMTQAALFELGSDARRAFNALPIVAGGLVSGHPDWLDGLDLSWADAIAIHPYLRDAPNPSDLEDLADVDTLVREYGRFGKRIVVSEWGWWGTDEKRGENEVRDMIGWAASTDLVALFCYFCLTDSMVPPFGLLREDGTEKPSAAWFRQAAKLAVPGTWPPVVEPELDPVPVPFVPTEDLAIATAWRSLWQAVVPSLDYHEGWAIPAYWREHFSELGSPIGFEIDGGGGITVQPFTHGILRYRPDAGVDRVA